MIPVILSGGSGSRLWPLSRQSFPKQFLPLVDANLSMLQQTALRLEGIEGIENYNPIVVCNEAHRFTAGEQMAQLGLWDKPKVILEPSGRNTAPAIALAALQVVSENDDVMVVMPADHVVEDVAGFQAAIEEAVRVAESGQLVTFGIVPQSPETGFGYIQSGERLGHSAAMNVVEFKEKPDLETAKAYIEAGNYFWNSGIFVFKASRFLEELEKYAPQVYQACSKAVESIQEDLDFLRPDSQAFIESPSISIDYAVMENSDAVSVIPIDVGWSDVGSWSAMWDAHEQDAEGNATHGDVLLENASDNFIYAEQKLVAALGVEDLVIVESDDAILVTSKAHSQDVKSIVNQLSSLERTHVEHHRKVHRPWGWYDSIDMGERFQVKRIQVKPGAKLSVQRHQHRAEHWVVVKGVAEVLNNGETFTLKENESTYIPIGVIHALANPSESEPLEIIEVQSGGYLGEDDIERFEDRYGRA